MGTAITAGTIAIGAEEGIAVSEALGVLGEGLLIVLAPEIIIPILAVAAIAAIAVFAVSAINSSTESCPEKDQEADTGKTSEEETTTKQDSKGGDPENQEPPRQRPKRITNPKHNPNSASPEPANVDELYDESIEDKGGTRWAKGKDGVIHRFSRPSNGETHWNGSTEGPNGIREQNIPNAIRRLLK